MKNFSILMLALAFCLFTQEADAQSNRTAKPKILDEKTWAWKPSTFNYAKYTDLVFEVGMGNHPNGGGAADAGIEIENADTVKVIVDTPLPFIYMDNASFAGFMVDYHTTEGYTKRVGLALGLYSTKREVRTPIWGKCNPPDQFVDLGKKKEYDLDLKKWAPEGWDGKVWFTVSLQNSGRNTKLKAKAELFGEQEKPLVAQKTKEGPGKTIENPTTSQEDKGANPPKAFTNSLGMKFVWIPPGSFMMGSPKDEKGRETNESHHKVTLTKGFLMGVYTVTQEEWQAVMGNNPSNFKGEKNLPVETVSWDDCQEFIKKLREKDKKPYRLPTEAEWEFAARAGTTTPFHFGETISTDQANYNGEPYGKGNRGRNRGKTTPVGIFPANAFGLHDMHGNLWQWCQDRLGDYSQDSLVDPPGSEKGNERVLRGGSWGNTPQNCRSACRHADGPGYRYYRFGLRICVGSTETVEVAQNPKEEPAKSKDDKALLQGRWYAVAEEYSGKTQSRDEILTMNKILDVKGDDFHMERTNGGKRGSYVGTMRLGQGDGQKLFDFEGKGPSGAQVELHGIYELTEDGFKVCYAVVPAGTTYTRPREFRTFAGTPTVFVTFKRAAEKVEVAQKPKEEPGKKEEKETAKKNGPFHELSRLPMRPDTPWTIAISPDGRLLASGGIGKDTRIYVADLRTCTPLYALEGHTKDVSAVVFSLDSKSLYSGSIDGTVREWDMATGIEKRTIVEAVAVNANKDVSSVFALALSPDGKMLAVACPYLMDGNILLVIRLLTVSGKELLAFPTGKEILWGLAFSPNGKMLATAGPNKIAKVWEVATGKELAELKGHKMAVPSVTFSPDGKFLATSGTDKAIKVWNVSSWAEIAAPTEQTLTDSKINSPAPVVFSPDGRFLAAGGIGDVVQVWDTGTNKRITAITVPTVMGSGGIVSLAFSSDSSLLAIGSSWDKRIHLWGLERPGSVAARLVNLGYSTEATVTRNQNVRTIFLSELMEENVKVELDWFRKNGTVRTGFKEEDKRDIPIEIHGVTSPHGIFMHPTHKSYASVSYPLRGRYSRFQATAAIPPVIEGQGDPASPLQFEVRGNGRILWKSRVLTELGQVDHCDIGLERLEGLNHLELRVNCPGRPNWAVAVWLEPRLVQKVVDFSKIDYGTGPNGEKIVERQGFDKEINKNFTEQGFIGLQGQFVRHGKLTNWHQQPMAGKEGRRLSEDYWFNGKRHGKLVQWYESGKVMREAVSEHGIEIGKDQWWHENGQRRVEAAYVNGALNGMGTTWYDNGKKRNEGAWLSGKEHGNWTWWYDNGQKMREASFAKGRWDGKFMEWNIKGEKTVELVFATGRIVRHDPLSSDDITSLMKAIKVCEAPDVKAFAAIVLVANGLEDKVPASILEKEAAKGMNKEGFSVDEPGLGRQAEHGKEAKDALKVIQDSEIIRRLVADKKARPINIRIDTATKKQQKLLDFMIDGFNSCITNESAYKTDSDIILRFNGNPKGWPLIEGSHIEGNLCHPLLISVYNKDGQRLTRFTTKEVYTVFSDTFQAWEGRYDAGLDRWEPRFLGRFKSTLTFRLNAQIIRDAALIEVGFCDARE